MINNLELKQIKNIPYNNKAITHEYFKRSR